MKATHAVLALALLGGGCAPAAPAPAEELDGTYLFGGLGGAQPAEFSNPLVDFGEIRPSSRLEIRREGDMVRVCYPSMDGREVVRTAALAEALSFRTEVPVGGPRFLPGFARQARGVRMGRRPDGALQVSGWFEERGWMCCLVPFTDRSSKDLVLGRAP